MRSIFYESEKNMTNELRLFSVAFHSDFILRIIYDVLLITILATVDNW